MSQLDKVHNECADECCAQLPLGLPSKAVIDRAGLVPEAFRLEWLTIARMTVEAVVAITAAIMVGSLALMPFGLDSVIELASSGVLIWRLSIELRHGQQFAERAERRASRIGGALPFALAAYVTGAAIWSLATRSGQGFSWPLSSLRWLPFRQCATSRSARSSSPRRLEAVPCGLTPWKP